MRTAVLLLTALLVAACSNDKPGDLAQKSPSQSSTTSEATPQNVEPNASTMNPITAVQRDNPGARVETASRAQAVDLLEYSIHMPDTLPAGRVSLNIRNAGKEKHGFEIEGNGIEEKTTELTGGSTTSLEVDLKPGTYTIYCPVDGHRGKGMQKKITVK